MRGESSDTGPWGIFGRGKAFRVLLAAFLLPSWAVGAAVSPCPGDALPIQIMMPGFVGSKIKRSADEIPRHLSHFYVFVTTVTKHVAARLAKDNLCIHGADNMASSEWATRSLLQFVHWRHVMSDEYLAPSMDASGASLLSSCQISSPWMDLIVDRRPAPLIRGIIYWNERQMLADQAALAGAKNVSPGRAMPLNPSAEAHFRGEYWRSEVYRRPATKPVEERVPPDLLWLFRRIWPDGPIVSSHPDVEPPTKKGMAGYTWLVRTLIDRCFDPSAPGRVDLHYNSILDVTDPILLDLYKIDMPNRRQSEPSPGEVS